MGALIASSIVVFTGIAVLLCVLILRYCWTLSDRMGPWAYVCHFMQHMLVVIFMSSLSVSSLLAGLTITQSIFWGIFILVALLIAYYNFGIELVISMTEYKLEHSKDIQIISMSDYFNSRDSYCYKMGNLGIRNKDGTVSLIRVRYPTVFGGFLWIESLFSKNV